MEKQSHFTFHVILTEMSPEKSPEDCWAVLRAAKNDFLAVLGKVYPEEMPLECAECCLVLYYLEATVILKHLQPPGVVEHMTWFDIYFTQVRPQLLSSKRSRTTLDNLGGDKRFFVSTTGRPVFNASNDLNRLHQKYKLDPVTYQTARRIFETATKDLTDQEKSLVADYLTHSTATADEHYRMKQSRNVVLASKLLKKLAGDSRTNQHQWWRPSEEMPHWAAGTQLHHRVCRHFIYSLPVERVSSFKYLGIYICEDLTWTLNTTQLVKKAQQRLYFLRRLRKFGMSRKILSNFYSCIVESTLTSCITAWSVVINVM
ncbi:uncharacterized protein [Paramormyrops kingsleyae]|uniref:uncharacterized protein n=1 Tax=Paramormyrops kingsleyae TaxID=1676925 RepID=UPI003B9700BE